MDDTSSDEDFILDISSEKSSETESDEDEYSKYQNLKLKNLKWSSNLQKNLFRDIQRTDRAFS